MAEEVTNRTERAVKGTLVSFLQYGTQMLLQAFLAPLVLRLAGQETLGAYALLMQVVGYLAMLDLGFSVTLNRYLAQASGLDDGGKRFRDVLSTARTFLLGSNLLIAALTVLVSFNIEVLFSLTPQIASQARLGLAVLAVWTVARTPWVVYGIGLNATQNLVAANSIGIIGNSGRLLFSLGLVFAGTGLVGLMAATVLAEALATLLSSSHFRRIFPQHRPQWGIPDRKLFKEMLSFSLQAMLISVAWRLVYYTDNIVVGYLYGAAAVSVYYTTQMPATIGFNIANRVSDNAAPAVNELYARQERVKLREVFLRLHRFNFLLVIPLAAGLALLNRELVSLWVGKGQYAGDLMSCALAAFTLLITVSHVSWTFVFASGQIRTLSWVSLFEGAANLGLSLWLGRLIGLPGVMVATVLASIPTTAYLLAVSLRGLDLGAGEFLGSCFLPSVLPVVAGCAALLVTRSALGSEEWFSFLAQGLVLLLAYGSLAYRFNLAPSERDWLQARFARFAQKSPLPEGEG